MPEWVDESELEKVCWKDQPVAEAHGNSYQIKHKITPKKSFSEIYSEMSKKGMIHDDSEGMAAVYGERRVSMSYF